MTASGIKEIISLVGIGLLIIAIAFIQLSRRKLKGWLATVVSMLAFLCLMLGAIIVVFIVFSGPTN